MNATCDNMTKAKLLAVADGIKKGWCIQYYRGCYRIVSDVWGQRGSRRKYHITDYDAIDMARKAGVQCDDEGLLS